MSESHTFSKLDADRILQRAAELEGSDTRRLTLDELRSIAGEAGFRPQAVERAIAEAQAVRAVEVRAQPVQRWGFIVAHYAAARELPVSLTADQLMRAVRLFHPYRDGSVQVELQERELSWKDRRGLEFTVTSSLRGTEIRVHTSRVMPVRRGRLREWVKAAADRLETLVLMVGAGGAVDVDAAVAPPRGREALPPGSRTG